LPRFNGNSFTLAAPPLLLLQDTQYTLGGHTPLLDGAELSVSAGERICLVGRNGSGKSTLLKIAAGLLAPQEGSRFLPMWKRGLGPVTMSIAPSRCSASLA
jgi:energy-coupling factor transporter ATP-binding protein EcfA2